MAGPNKEPASVFQNSGLLVRLPMVIKGWDFSLGNCVCSGIVVSIVFLLKYHYSTASCDDLIWILKPTALIVEHVTSISFPYQKNIGFVSESERLIIAPVCAGVNFLVILIGMSSLGNIYKLQKTASKLKCILMIIAIAYLYTVCINAIRITAGILISKNDIFTTFLSATVFHKIEGILIFFGGMYIFNIFINKVIEFSFSKNHYTEKKKVEYSSFVKSGIYALVWYLGVMLFVPIVANGRDAGAVQLINHALLITIIPIFMISIIFFITKQRRLKKV